MWNPEGANNLGLYTDRNACMKIGYALMKSGKLNNHLTENVKLNKDEFNSVNLKSEWLQIY